MALSVDVEEWYHNCWVPEYVRPELRPPLTEELDRSLPELLDRLDRLDVRATFFVLGEVAARLPGRIREIDARGHEVACHGELHLRADDRPVAAFVRDIATARHRLEQIVGRPVTGFRSPEWSLRRPQNPRLRAVARAGFAYDSSLTPAAGAGGAANPTQPVWIRWGSGEQILELPPWTFGGRLRLPAGGWTARVAATSWLRRSVMRGQERDELALLVVHPWELTDRPCPGLYTGLARWFHDGGRLGFATRFDAWLDGLPCRATLAELAARARAEVTARAPEAIATLTAQAVGVEP